MATPTRPNERINSSEARQNFAKLLNRVYREQTRVVVEKSGIPMAALVSTEDLERLIQFDREREQRALILEELRAPFRDIPADDLEQEIDRALKEVRAEMRAERPSGVVGG